MTFDRKKHTLCSLYNIAIVLSSLLKLSALYLGTGWTVFFIFIIDAAPHYFIVSLLLMTDAE